MSSTDHTQTSSARLRRRYVAALASGLLLAGGLVAAAAPATASVPVRTLDVTAHDSGNEAPPNNRVSDWYTLSSDHLTAGLVDVRLHNAGSTDHQVQFVRLHDGITAAQYIGDLVSTQGGSALAEGDATAGSNAITPGGFQETWVNLSAGNYVALCFLDGLGKGPHFAHGMWSGFTVTGQGNSAHPPGYVRSTISAYSFGFHMPAVIDGHGIYRFTNTDGSDTHELTLIKLAEGATADYAKNWIEGKVQGPPPFGNSAGGSGALAPGGESWVRMNLEPGDYIAVCFVPDDDNPNHPPHAALGMVQGFHVDG